jgi:hypothetical protein
MNLAMDVQDDETRRMPPPYLPAAEPAKKICGVKL